MPLRAKGLPDVVSSAGEAGHGEAQVTPLCPPWVWFPVGRAGSRRGTSPLPWEGPPRLLPRWPAGSWGLPCLSTPPRQRQAGAPNLGSRQRRPTAPVGPAAPPGQARGDAKGTGAFRLLPALLRAEAGPRARPESQAGRGSLLSSQGDAQPALSSCRETCHRASRPVTGASAGSSLSAYGAAAAFGSCEIQMPAPGWSPPQGQLGLGAGGSSRLCLDACLLPSLAHLRSPGPVPAAVPLSPCLVPSGFLSGAPAARGSTGAGAALRGKAPLGAPAQAPAGGGRAAGPPPQPALPALPAPPPHPPGNEGRRAGRWAGGGGGRRPQEAGLCSNHLGEDGRLLAGGTQVT